MKNFNDRGNSRGFGGRGGFGRNAGRSSQMYNATCSDCGNSCEVPFKPFHGKPVYCNDCFGKNRDSAPGRSGGGNFGKFQRRDSRDSGRPSFGDRGDRQMFGATCAECGERCEVPFRPNGEKPVYCNDCFEDEGDDFESKPSFRPKKPDASNESLNQLNTKLDKILKALEIIMQKREFIVERPAGRPPLNGAEVKTPEVKKPETEAPVKKAAKPSKPKKKK